MQKRIKFFGSALGIFVCYFYYGILQERITRGKYGGKNGEEEEKFVYALSLVLVQCVINFIFARLMLSYIMPQGEDTTKSVYYSLSALMYFLAMVASNMALQWVNYPTQVVAKSCKPIPVMVLGVLIGRKSYIWRKYLFVILIVLGVTLFMLKEGKSRATSENGLGVGELLLLSSLMMDGLLGAIQERMKAEHETRSGHMMLGLNKWSTLYLSVAVIATGEIVEFWKFVGRHPAVLWQLGSLAAAGAFGQYFILFVVSEFGPLPSSIVTTTRKFFTVLGSVILFGNTLVLREWAGTTLVFTGLFLDALYGKSPSKKK
ncbi:hypothetical protein J437_LFUL011782 [Ladona fulva]|uniref:Solute carrier family 35 member B1 n=1 Tax=Ladona fulva TaxID=123851 RepID=A0A8K0P3M0_LADFU|nr:hypothetical protein J437_LFUL011782 [Ladona fulva]